MKDKRILLGCLFIVLLAVGFWSGSRIPQLNEKASMGAETDMNALGFDTVFQVQPDDPKVTQILYTTINWMDTNKKGMAFGVLFAAALMTLFSLLRKKSFKSGFANSALGMVIGAPLGVCVNCAAPIAVGMAAGGTRVETTLATMISSPTLNIIVLTMLFSLFPFYIVLIKIGFTVGFILVIIPLLSRFLLKTEVVLSSTGSSCGILPDDSGCLPLTAGPPQTDASSDWLQAMRWLISNFTKNLWFILKTTVPLMVLAGFLGSLLIALLPWDSLADVIPSTSRGMTLLSMGMVALVGIFLPVPIAFDVIVSAVLLAAGMPVKYLMILLFTLGIFSIYSFFIIWKSISKRSAITLFIVLAGLGVVTGIVAHEYDAWEKIQNRKMFLQFLVQTEGLQEPRFHTPQLRKGERDDELVLSLQRNALIPEAVSINGGDGIEVARIAFQNRVATPGKHFSKFQGSRFGLNEPFHFSFFKMVMPFSLGHGRGIATGDIHNDGWPDVLFVSEAELSLYANRRGERYVRQNIGIPLLSDLTILNAALVDLNNDGWLDIFFSTYGKGNYVIYNQEGRFTQEQFHPLPHYDDEVMSTAAGFGDVDRDGDLDIILGNWSIGWGSNWMSSGRSRNILLQNEKEKFLVRPLPGIPGAPLSILLTDYNSDSYLDLIIGSDFGPPDNFYLGNGNGGFTVLTKDDGIIPHSTHETMSVTTADINNDLQLEIYLGDVARYSDSHETFGILSIPEVCGEITDQADKTRCRRYTELHQMFSQITQTNDVGQCLTIDEQQYREECIVFFFVRRPLKHGGREICSLLPDSWKTLSLFCRSNLQEAVEPTEAELERAIPQQWWNNVLLMSTGDGHFVDKASDMGVNLAGFSWNSKFADLDNDEWQDLYVVNGWFQTEKRRESNYFFHNQKGQGFVNKTEEYGLSSFLATSAYSYVDMDNDGDLDIITIPVNGPILVFANNSDKNHSIAFELRDQVGNSFGIGSKIIIHYGPNEERHQMREIQASGGFISFDSPIAYFGLGDFKQVDWVEVLWSTGERSEIRGNFAAGSRYKISRNK